MEKELDESTEASPEVQKLWNKFDKEYSVFIKGLKKAGIDTMVVSELDDYEYEMFNLLGVH